jgi:GntR family transcriptional regulator
MLTIDRAAQVPVHHQIADQMRFAIVRGEYRVGEMLPSTRELARRVQVSFHTVRKAYRLLETEGLVLGVQGAGFRVRERTLGPKTQRMERGAALIHDALQHLISLGLDEGEIDYLFQEQIGLLNASRGETKVIFLATEREVAEAGAEQVSQHVPPGVLPVTFREVGKHHDADLVICAHRDISAALSALPRADVHGVSIHFAAEALEAAARLLTHQTLLLITRYEDGVRSLVAEVSREGAVPGNAIGISIESDFRQLRALVSTADLVLYTPPTRRRIAPLLKDAERSVEMAIRLETSSLDRLRTLISG